VVCGFNYIGAADEVPHGNKSRCRVREVVIRVTVTERLARTSPNGSGGAALLGIHEVREVCAEILTRVGLVHRTTDGVAESVVQSKIERCGA
jgi:hypothetical protein